MFNFFNKKRIIGKGTYGCVIYPSIPGMDTKEDTKCVSKILDNRDAILEIKYAKILKQIDPFFDRFIYPINVLKITEKQRNTVKRIIRCKELMPKMRKNGRDIILDTNLVMPRYGISLKKFMNDYKYTHDDIYKIEFYLKQSIKILKKNGLYHMDLRLDNILIDPSTKIPKIIDFGISMDKIIIDNYKSRIKEIIKNEGASTLLINLKYRSIEDIEKILHFITKNFNSIFNRIEIDEIRYGLVFKTFHKCYNLASFQRITVVSEILIIFDIIFDMIDEVSIDILSINLKNKIDLEYNK